MLKYEKKLNLDKAYEDLKENMFFNKYVMIITGLIGYFFFYVIAKKILLLTNFAIPWKNETIWFEVFNIPFLKVDLILFILGLITVLYGSLRLIVITKEKNKSSSLLTSGNYSKVRHPMYGTFILLQTGFLLSLRSFFGILFSLIVILIQYLNAVIEERKILVPLFKEEYLSYSKEVKRRLLNNGEILLIVLLLLINLLGYLI